MKINSQLLIVLISFGITVFISALFGFAGSTIIGTFWAWFAITMLSLFIIFAVVNSFLIQRDIKTEQETELELLEKASKFTVRLTCSYCQQQNLSVIQLDRKNTFKCESCNQVNGISMQFMATALTTPLESVKLPIENSTAEFKVK
jgi:transcription elongation factor Elf1